MDVARIIFKTKYSMALNDPFNIDVNNDMYRMKIVEDSYGPKRTIIPGDGGSKDQW